MKPTSIYHLTACAAIAMIYCALSLSAATNYVWLGSPSPATPYTNWNMAAHSIQQAVDAAVSGDMVLVSNGVYRQGGSMLPNTCVSNRVQVTNAIVVRSVSGPAATVIEGARSPLGSGLGSNAVRCVFLTNNALLAGFTLSNGFTANTGGDYSYNGGGAFVSRSAVLSNCVVTCNTAFNIGGGIVCHQGGLARDSVVSYNTGSAGGGVYCMIGCMISNCLIFRNNAVGMAGGVFLTGMMADCVVSNNTANGSSASGGGGVLCWGGGSVDRCVFSGNRTITRAGGGIQFMSGGTARNCLIVSNSAPAGGGVQIDTQGTLDNCTIAANSATNAGGVWLKGGGTVRNSIVKFNAASNAPNYLVQMLPSGTGTFDHCCLDPLPATGMSNIVDNPLLVNLPAGDCHLDAASPCIDTGTNLPWMASATDLDGNPRIVDTIVDMGCFEFAPEPAGAILLAMLLAIVRGVIRGVRL